jgi:hypothetical protein
MDVAPSFIYSDNDDNFKSTYFQTTKDDTIFRRPSRNELSLPRGGWLFRSGVDRKKTAFLRRSGPRVVILPWSKGKVSYAAVYFVEVRTISQSDT